MSGERDSLGVGRRVTDAAGVTAEYRPVERLVSGDKIIGGWLPHPVVRLVEKNGTHYRVYYKTHGPTEWFKRGTEFPVAVDE